MEFCVPDPFDGFPRSRNDGHRFPTSPCLSSDSKPAWSEVRDSAMNQNTSLTFTGRLRSVLCAVRGIGVMLRSGLSRRTRASSSDQIRYDGIEAAIELMDAFSGAKSEPCPLLSSPPLTYSLPVQPFPLVRRESRAFDPKGISNEALLGTDRSQLSVFPASGLSAKRPQFADGCFKTWPTTGSKHRFQVAAVVL